MKRFSLFIITIFFTTLANAGIPRVSMKSLMTYTILSEEFDSSIPKGKSQVIGQVFDQNDNPLSNSLIATFDFKHQGHSDSLGQFAFEMDSNDSAIFCFHLNYSEVLVYHDFKSQHRTVIKFMLPQDVMQITVDKPVIYCYAPTPLSITITPDFKSNLSFSYPPTKKGKWQVDLQKNGLEVNHQPYPYLFWEGKSNLSDLHNPNQKTEGYILKTDTLISFLENQLNAFGFNNREKTDFITYWGPRMAIHNFVLIEFMTGDAYAEHIAEMQISPQPDEMLQLFMLFRGFEQYPDFLSIEEPASPIPLKRNGFTYVEWGGSEIPSFLNL